MNALIRMATEHDIEVVARNMRVRDVEEIKAASGRCPLDSLRAAFTDSALVWAACNERGPFVIFGVNHFFADVGAPWLLATDDLAKHRRQFLSVTPAYIDQMHQQFPVLINYVDARHTDSIRWLRWCGFDIAPAETHGVERRPFHRFSRVQPCVNQ